MEQENPQTPEKVLEDGPDFRIVDRIGDYVIITQRAETRRAQTKRAEFETIVLFQNYPRVMLNDPEYLIISREGDKYGLAIAMEFHESTLNKLAEILNEAA